MNFFGLHTYPEKGPNAEPTVWIGPPGEYGEDGTVQASYPSSYQNTRRGNWGYEAKKTGDFHFGASRALRRGRFRQRRHGRACAPSRRRRRIRTRSSTAPPPSSGARFGLARKLGVKTCVGTETALDDPRRSSRSASWPPRRIPRTRPSSPRLYQGMFGRIARAYPVDYYWFWTWEGWTWSGRLGRRDQGRHHRPRRGRQGLAGGRAVRSAWPPAAGSSARPPTGRSSTRSCPRTWP